MQEKQNYIWFDGKFVESNNARVSILTHALHYGSSVFDGIRVYQGKPFKLTEHIERLLHSAGLIGMQVTYTKEVLKEACYQLIAINNKVTGYIRPIIWRGDGDLRVGGYNNIHLAIAIWNTMQDQRIQIEDKKPISLTISNWRKPPTNVFPLACKGAGAYVMNTVAKHQAENLGFDDALMLDTHDYIAEATTSNIFMIRNNKLITPPPVNILNGITRQTVMNIAVQCNIEVTEQFFTLEELLRADEVFLTGTTIEILPVSRIENTIFCLGNVTKLLAKKFFALVDNI